SDAFLLPEIETLLGTKLTSQQPEADLLIAPEEAPGAKRLPRTPRSGGRSGGGRPGGRGGPRRR
ncbi:MAG: hypothetical protein ACO2YV_06660, partial [Pseudomonadales bacterium]